MHFWVYLLNYNSLSHQTWPINRYRQLQWFSGILWTIWRTGTNFQVLFNLANCSNYSTTNYAKIPVFHFSTFKNGKCQLLKKIRSPYIAIFINIIKGPETSFQSPTLNQKHVRNVFQPQLYTYITIYAYDDITDFEICGFQKTKKSRYLKNETFLFK